MRKNEKQVILKLVAILLFSFSNSCPGVSCKSSFSKEPVNISADTSYQQHFRIIKINPFQILFCEIPLSFESFHDLNKSIQFQLGFIFPLRESSELRRELLDIRYNSTLSNEENYSYRKSPFYNYGLSFKIEFRKYGRRLYYAPQLMYKNCFYKEAIFPIHGGGVTLYQTESKKSNIFGFGFILGKQSYEGNMVLDWYGGVGLRHRSMSVKILKIENPAFPAGTSYPDSEKNYGSFYPFINFGLRLGFKL